MYTSDELPKNGDKGRQIPSQSCPVEMLPLTCEDGYLIPKTYLLSKLRSQSLALSYLLFQLPKWLPKFQRLDGAVWHLNQEYLASTKGNNREISLWLTKEFSI